MKNHRNQSKNFALAVSEYVPKALIPIARVYVHPPLMKAIDYVISKEILTSDTVAFNYFIDIRKREMESAENLIEEVEEIHRKGYLGRILLFEYKKLDLLYPADPKPDVHEETKNFELKVYRLATKKPEEKVDAICLGKYIKAVVVPIARVETLEYFGIEAHLKFIGESLEKGINTFYVVAAGEGNIYLARQVVGEAEKRYKLRKIREDEYHGIHRGKRMKMFVGTLVRNESTT